jgi:hypothetical protein
MAGCSAPRAAILLLALPLILSAVLGIGVEIQPDTIGDRNPISITLSNVTDGLSFNVTITATFLPSPDTSWLNLTNWIYPFALHGGGATVSGQNVNQLTLLVRSGSTLRTRRDSGAGNITLVTPLDFPAVLYHDFRLGYEAHDPDAPLTLTLIQQGTKAGPDDAVLTPSIFGIREGNLTVKVLTNGTLQASKEIRVLEAEPSPTPTTPAPLSPTPTAPPETIPAPTSPAPIVPLSPSPTVTSSPAPATETGSPSPWILGFVTIIILIALIADYLLLKD